MSKTYVYENHLLITLVSFCRQANLASPGLRESVDPLDLLERTASTEKRGLQVLKEILDLPVSLEPEALLDSQEAQDSPERRERGSATI